MVDSLSPLPPINARITKTTVSEKDPHHQNNKQHKEHKPDDIEDEITINLDDQPGIAKVATQDLNKLQPNINIEV
jgi:hypothetical protein